MLAWPNGGVSMLTTTDGMAPTLKFLRLCGFVIEFWVGTLYAGDLRWGVSAQAAPLLFSRKAELPTKIRPPGPIFPPPTHHPFTFLCRHQGEQLPPSPRG